MQRRRLLSILGGASTLGLQDRVAGERAGRSQETPECSRPRCIHPILGYTGFPFEDLAGLPVDLLPDHQVELVSRARENSEVVSAPSSGAPGAVGRTIPEGYFDPTGLAVDAGDVVAFTADAPGHTVTAYHPQFGRQRRVPEGTSPFSSPVLGEERFWLYRFEDPGVYDLFGAPHEIFGAAMRIVVDGGDPAFGQATAPGRRPPQLTAGLVLEDDALAPETIDERGAVGWDELAPGSTQRLVEFSDPLQALVERFEGDDTHATAPFELDGGFLVAVYDHAGAGRFVVELVDTAGEERGNRIADDFDAASGITALGIAGGEYVLDVQAGGPWTVALALPGTTDADADGLPVTIDGEGPDYFGPLRFDGLVRATATHHGTGSFFVEGYDADGGRAGGVVFDEGGRFQGQTTFTYEGIGWITVNADGKWTITLERVA